MRGIRTILRILFFCSLISGCRKDDNPKVPNYISVPVPLLTLDAGSDTKISGLTPAAFVGTFTIDVYFKNAERPKSLDLVVVKNHDASNAKTILADITVLPMQYSVTGQFLMDLFGEPIVPGDIFEISTDIITQDGFRFKAFHSGGISFAPGVYNMPGSSPVLTFAAPCKFSIDLYEGDFVIERDDWGDYEPGDDIAITLIDDTHMSFKYKADNAVPIIMEIDPQTNAVSVEKQLYGSYNGDDYFAESLPGDESTVDPCVSAVSINIRHSTSIGTLDGVIVMKRK